MSASTPVEEVGTASQAAWPGLPLAPLLRRLRPQRPHALIAPFMWDVIEQAGKLVPATSEFGFECHLLSDGSRADLVVRVSRTDRSASMLSRLHSSRLGDQASIWPRVIEFCSHWCSADTAPDSASEALWLEFDARELHNPLPQPSIAFLYVAAAARRSLHGTVTDAIERTLPMLTGKATDDRLANAIITCIGAVAPSCELSHFGVELARSGSEARICFRSVRDAIGPSLTALGLGAMADHVADILAPLDETCRVTLQIALTPAIAPKLGLEIGSSTAAGWNSILACLLERNLCTLAEATAIVRWASDPGELNGSFPWPPVGAGWLSDDVSRFAEATIWRLPSHVKLSVSAGHQISAKAYLYVGAVWPTVID